VGIPGRTRRRTRARSHHSRPAAQALSLIPHTRARSRTRAHARTCTRARTHSRARARTPKYVQPAAASTHAVLTRIAHGPRGARARASGTTCTRWHRRGHTGTPSHMSVRARPTRARPCMHACGARARACVRLSLCVRVCLFCLRAVRVCALSAPDRCAAPL
jgi:hypothetical protein